MNQDVNEWVVLVHWKRFGGMEIDVFSSLRGFCKGYPEYDYDLLKGYLTEQKIPFENLELKIEWLPVYDTVLRPDLPRVLFWDFDYDKLDWRRSYKTIIERVLDKGSMADWEVLLKFYGRDFVIDALKKDITYLSDSTADAVCAYFELNITELRCYAKRQSNQGH